MEGAHVRTADNTTGAGGANDTLDIEGDQATAGRDLSGVGAAFPRDHLVVDGAKHADVGVGLDTGGDGSDEHARDAGAHHRWIPLHRAPAP